MDSERFNANDLTPIQTDEAGLSSTLRELRIAIDNAVSVICSKSPPQGHSDRHESHDSVYVGD